MSGGGIANNGVLNIGYSTALTIEKKVSGTPNGADDTFTFIVTLTDNNDVPYVGNVLYEYHNAENTITFDGNGQASLSLHSNESVILFNIPNNIKYKVEEMPAEGFVLSEHTGTSGVISITEKITASFTNTYQSAAAEIGSLKITKTVAGTGTPSPDTTFIFTVKNGISTAVGNYSINDGTAAPIPASGEITLADGQTATLTDLSVGNYTITESLPSQANYKSTQYKEGNKPDENGLTANVTITNGNTQTVEFTNIYEQKIDKISIIVVKSWQDNNNQDGIRPNYVTVKLFADGTYTGQAIMLNAGNNWTASFIDLPQKKNGTLISYSIQEVMVAGYFPLIFGNEADGFTIINSHTPDIPGTQNPGTQNPETQNPGTQNPETQNPETQNPETQKPETQKPETQKPETQNPETQNSETQNPETQKPETQNPETQNPETQNPETQNPETQNPETQNPETQNPETQNPETQKPETQNPETQNPETQKPETQNPETQKPETQKPQNPKLQKQKTQDTKSQNQDPQSQDPQDHNIPKTGDNSNYLIGIVLMLVSLGGMVCVLIIRKRHYSEK